MPDRHTLTADNLDKLADFIEQHVPDELIRMRHHAARDPDEMRTRVWQHGKELSRSEVRALRLLPLPDFMSRIIWSHDAIPECDTTASALGWAAACFIDDIKELEGARPIDYPDMGKHLFPLLYGPSKPTHTRRHSRRLLPTDPNKLYNRVFRSNLSRQKPKVLERLRDLAKELREEHRKEIG